MMPTHSRLSLLVAATAALLFGACADQLFDLEGTRCGEAGECGGGLVCDSATQTCLRARADAGCDGGGDAGLPDGGSEADAGEEADAGSSCDRGCGPLGRCGPDGVTCECLGGARPCDDGCCQAQTVALGTAHTCRLDLGGLARCWGDNSRGQLGDPTAAGEGGATCLGANAWLREEIVFDSLTAGARTTCGLDTQRHLWCWGDNREAQVTAIASTAPAGPTMLEPTRSFAAVSMAAEHGCGLAFDGELVCWGTGAPAVVTSEPVFGVAAGGGDDAGEAPFTCVIEHEKREVRCHGAGFDSTTIYATGALGVAAGETHACAINAERNVVCWDSLQSEAQVVMLESSFPLSNVVQVVTGMDKSCALDADGKLWCWGRVDCSTAVEPVAALVSEGLTNPSALDCGRAHTCWEAGILMCSGDTSSGQIKSCDSGLTCYPAAVPVQ